MVEMIQIADLMGQLHRVGSTWRSGSRADGVWNEKSKEEQEGGIPVRKTALTDSDKSHNGSRSARNAKLKVGFLFFPTRVRLNDECFS